MAMKAIYNDINNGNKKRYQSDDATQSSKKVSFLSTVAVFDDKNYNGGNKIRIIPPLLLRLVLRSDSSYFSSFVLFIYDWCYEVIVALPPRQCSSYGRQIGIAARILWMSAAIVVVLMLTSEEFIPIESVQVSIDVRRPT